MYRCCPFDSIGLEIFSNTCSLRQHSRYLPAPSRRLPLRQPHRPLTDLRQVLWPPPSRASVCKSSTICAPCSREHLNDRPQHQRCVILQPRATPWVAGGPIFVSPEGAQSRRATLGDLAPTGLCEFNLPRTQGVALGCRMAALSGLGRTTFHASIHQMTAWVRTTHPPSPPKEDGVVRAPVESYVS